MPSQEEMMMLMQMQKQQEMEKVLKQNEDNKAHDTELTEFADGQGAETLNVIGENEVRAAYEEMLKYKREKSTLEARLERNEMFWKMRHWEYMSEGDDNRIHPKSAWLVNTIMNKHADAMDNYPEPNILPRAFDDEETAKVLSEVIPVILERNDFEETYDRLQWFKNKNGVGMYGVFWDNDKEHGLGDIAISHVSLANLYWKGGIKDIQESPNVFYVTMMENDDIKARWPEVDVTSGVDIPITSGNIYNKDENIDTTTQTPVIDWYYRRRIKGVDENGIPKTDTVLHYCKFVNNNVIYASENDPKFAESGWYRHGMYPFVPDVLFPVENSICGMGYIDLVADDQMFTDKLRQAILENACWAARPRHAVRDDAGLNEHDFMDL